MDKKEGLANALQDPQLNPLQDQDNFEVQIYTNKVRRHC